MDSNQTNTKANLSLKDQETGRHRYLQFTRINAFSFGCLGEYIIILYAIKIGADDFIVGMLTSFFYLTMPMMLLGKKIVARQGAAHTYAISWILRNFSAAIMITVPLITKYVNEKTGLIVLILSILGFFAFRSMGLTANTPIIGEITDKSNRGNFISKIWMNFNIFFLITMLFLLLVLSQSDSTYIFQSIIGFGFVAGIISSLIIYRVPESSSTRLSGQQPIKTAISYIWNNTRSRKLFFAWTAFVISIVLINPFSMVALKNGYYISDRNAIFFSLIQIVGGILASYFNSMILDRVGPRPMLILFGIGFLTSSILWVLAPNNLIIYYITIIFLLIGICRSGAMTSLSHYFLTIVPETNRVGANLIIYMTTGLIAGITGTFLGGGLLKILRIMEYTNLTIYRIYFLIVFIVIIPLFFLIRRLERVADWHFKELMGIFVSFRDIRALFALQRLERDLNVEQEMIGVERLSEFPSDLSEKKLVAFLDSPRFIIRGKALRTLGHIKFSHKTTKRIIEELIKGEFTTAYIAAEILGENKIKDAIPLLRKSLVSSDVYLQGKTMLALVQLGDEVSYPIIIEIFRKSKNPRIIIHGARAIVEMKSTQDVGVLLNKFYTIDLPTQVEEELLYSLSEIAECSEEFYRVLKNYKASQNDGLAIMSEILSVYLKGSASRLNQFEQQINLLKKSTSYDNGVSTEFIKLQASDRNTNISHSIKNFIINKNRELSNSLVLCLILVLAKEYSSG